jgi:hypothetical protein
MSCYKILLFGNKERGNLVLKQIFNIQEQISVLEMGKTKVYTFQLLSNFGHVHNSLVMFNDANLFLSHIGRF